MSTPAVPALDLEDDVELWDGVRVIKGSPSAAHEALRASLISQLDAQRPPGTSVVVSSIAGDEHGFARSDVSVVDVAGAVTPVWVEVLSESDLRGGDVRLVGRRRRRWLFEHGVLSLWAVTDVFGALMLTVLDPDGTCRRGRHRRRPRLWSGRLAARFGSASIWRDWRKRPTRRAPNSHGPPRFLA